MCTRELGPTRRLEVVDLVGGLSRHPPVHDKDDVLARTMLEENAGKRHAVGEAQSRHVEVVVDQRYLLESPGGGRSGSLCTCGGPPPCLPSPESLWRNQKRGPASTPAFPCARQWPLREGGLGRRGSGLEDDRASVSKVVSGSSMFVLRDRC